MASDDQAARHAALDPGRSFVVQAPAGSGKTTLLTQRLLTLLTTVAQPEQVVAITFTRKAAEEMRARIIAALELATTSAPVDPFAAHTHALARAVLAHDAAQGWELRVQPARLRIMTIDALCQSIVRQAPISARLASAQQIDEDASDLYRAAARAAVAAIADQGPWQVALARLLGHFDNDWDKLERLLANMLGRRDQWLPVLGREAHRTVLEAAFAQVVAAELAPALAALAAPAWRALVPLAAGAGEALAASASPANALAVLAGLNALPAARQEELPRWHALTGLLLTAQGEWRKKVDKNLGFPPGAAAAGRKQQFIALLDDLRGEPALQRLLQRVARLPARLFEADEAEVVDALIVVLKLACAELQVQGEHSGRVDFSAYALAALNVLGDADAPSELALRLDYRLQHLLVDEFQDTSLTQYELILRLTAGWSGNDGRTLFLVGDPMQSIYRFRQADVRLFTRLLGGASLGSVALDKLELTVNFRAQAGLVEWINNALPVARARVGSADVPFVAQVAVKPALSPAWQVHGALVQDSAAEAAAVRGVIEAIQAVAPTASIAILVRSRSHLGQITADLLAHGQALAAREIEALVTLPLIGDLLALTRALLHAADRIAWLAVLRAPWCGARLATLVLFGEAHPIVAEALQDEVLQQRLPADERRRVGLTGTVMLRALGRAGAEPLSTLVERTWVALGGPSALTADTEAADARAYFSLLTTLEQDGQALTAERLQERLVGRFSNAPPSAQATVQVMTIHRAKGLEFDYVLVPGCGRRPRADDKPLLRWREDIGANGQPGLLLAPSPAKGASALYEYLHARERDEVAAEAVRLLYVALTRARRQVHLFGHAPRTPDGQLKTGAGSLFNLLWPCVEAAFAASLAADDPLAAGVGWVRPPPVLRRFSAAALAPAAFALAPPGGDKPLEFDWAGTTAKHIGTVAHRLLQTQSANQRPASWTPAIAAFARGQLRALGVPRAELDAAVDQIALALTRTAASRRGQWLFGPTLREVETELRLSVNEQGQLARVVIDRTFVDDAGRRWIVDFKTGSHGGGALDAYLASEFVRYRPQLERYGRIMAGLDSRPIMLGLYFPLLDAWHAWPWSAGRADTPGQ